MAASAAAARMKIHGKKGSRWRGNGSSFRSIATAWIAAGSRTRRPTASRRFEAALEKAARRATPRPSMASTTTGAPADASSS